VGARNNIYKLDATNIENVNSPLFAQVNLPVNSEQKEQCLSTYFDEKLCNNFIKLLIHRTNDKDLYICGTYGFTPRLFQFSYDLNLIREDDGYGYCSLNPLDSSTAIWIENGNPLNIGSLYSASLLDASTKTIPVEPVIYRPEIRRGDKSFQYLRTPKFDSDWLYQPTFIASFDVDDYVIFFLKEKSLEQIAEGQDQNYARVVRVCKNDMGAINLGNQWSSMRKSRLTCVYNNTYLNEIEDVIRVNDDLFAVVFSLKMPGLNSASYLCEFSKQALIEGLNLPANNFKELTPGTQYWSKIAVDKVPKNIPSQCNYNSQQLKDDVLNFLKTHSLIGDQITGNLIKFVNQQVTSIAVDTVQSAKSSDSEEITVYYLGTMDGRIVKVSNLDLTSVISEWKVGNEAITEMKIKPGFALYATTQETVLQIDLDQCNRYSICSTCMTDPYCGWNIRKNMCENTRNNNNLIVFNSNLCSKFQKQDNTKMIQVDNGASVRLDTGKYEEYLYDHIEWYRDQVAINLDPNFNNNIFVTTSKDLIILNGNATQNGVYSCRIGKTELIASYNVNFRLVADKASMGVSSNQKCITAENYIKQYNNWCDEYSRYQKALNDWENLKDKSCSAATNMKTPRN